MGVEEEEKGVEEEEKVEEKEEYYLKRRRKSITLSTYCSQMPFPSLYQHNVK